MLTTLPLEPLFRRDLWMLYKRRGGWNKQAAGLTNQANSSSGKSPVLLFLKLDIELKMSTSKSCQKIPCASWSIFFSAVAVRILERRPELELLESLLNRQTKAKTFDHKAKSGKQCKQKLEKKRDANKENAWGAREERGGQSVEYTEALRHHLTLKPSRIFQHTRATSWQRSQNYEDCSTHFTL